MKTIFGFIFMIGFLLGCQPAAVDRGAITQGTTTSPGNANYTVSDIDLGWYFQLTNFTTLSYGRENTLVAYLKGKLLENYLQGISSFTQKTYCIEMNFGSSLGSPFKARFKAVPITSLSNGKKTIYLRVDLNNTSAGTSACNLNAQEYQAGGTLVTVAPTDMTFNLSAICPNCLTTTPAVSLKIFQVNSGNTLLTQVNPNIFSLSTIGFSLAAPSSTIGNSLCSNSNCRSQGYDCCLEGQCVNDSAVKNGVNQSSPDFIAAASQVANNPLSFLNFPQFYYICPLTQPTDPSTTGGSSGGGNPVTEAQLRFDALKKDYYCIEHLKEKSLGTPWHFSPFNTSATYNQSICDTVIPNNEMYWEKVLLRLYDNCGCVGQLSLQDKLNNCPNYYYTATQTNAAGVPTQLECAALSTAPSGPFQNMTIPLSSKTAPHRFFKTDGSEIQLTSSALTNQTGTQEGDSFSYLDTSGVMPQNGSFNMNSVLGQMTVGLDKASPAKVVNVELSGVYFISTLSGNHTPCSTCSGDSWFSNFSATPSSSQGVGLQAYGHTTKRDEWSTNITLGNYEDTIFGRACFVPPTMIPFSHKKYTNAQTQRLTRLKTQAALYVNGYQRDWYGFNRGALIGSFDGVSWFAIGKGRIVRAKTKKLFLAINAPFADLANNANHLVSIQDFNGNVTAPVVDFDPSLTLNNPSQNEAATCQAYHQCSTDTDCITRLGWEYACADINDIKTKLPQFDATTASEIANAESTNASILALLNQDSYGSASTKRCVYRGAGSICAANVGAVSGSALAWNVNNVNKLKLLTCAPNFYCAPLSSSFFNKEVARFSTSLESIPVSNNHFFGKDANQLGRPLDYLSGSNLTSFTSDIQTSLLENISQMVGFQTLGTAGLCRPGKQMTETGNFSTMFNPFEQNRSLGGRDAGLRTDFISQIGPCASNYFSNIKTTSCPVVASDGNLWPYSSTSNYTMNPTTYSNLSSIQNSCGLSNLLNTTSTASSITTLQVNNPFKNIESIPLAQTTVFQPTLVRDACLRNPGSVCHTDLDCSPNKLHASEVDFFSTTYFGNEANKKYWQESMVCGQADPIPSGSDYNFNTYNMNLNRCCREVGSTLTTYTPNSPTNSLGTPSSLTSGLNGTISSLTAPNNTTRYDRLKVVENLGVSILGEINFPFLDAHAVRSGGGILSNSSQGTNIMTSGQWKTLNDVNKKSCCGGGWVRKFSDGSTDWSNANRLQLDVSNFTCLNYYTPLMTATASELLVHGTNYNFFAQDVGRYNFNADTNIAQIGIPSTLLTNQCSSQGSSSFDDTESCDTTTVYSKICANPSTVTNDDDGWQQLWTFTPTVPSSAIPISGVFSSFTMFSFFQPVSADGNNRLYIDLGNSDIPTRKHNAYFTLPSYIPDSFGGAAGSGLEGYTGSMPERNTQIMLARFTSNNSLDSGGAQACTYTNPLNCNSTSAQGSYDGDGTCVCNSNCCYDYIPSSRALRVVVGDNVGGPLYDSGSMPDNERRWSVVIKYRAPGTTMFKNYSTTAAQAKPACQESYYLNLLGSLELSGIPQITYSKLVCNNNISKLVPGIFKSNITSPANFNTNANSFLPPGLSDVESLRTTHHSLEQDPVFSEDEFKCCTPLGKLTKNKNTCCSGYGVSNGAGYFECLLPSKTNLNVYFNRFVSNEGIGATLPAGGLTSSDFEDQTGEPKNTNSVNSKIRTLGQFYCESGAVRRGGAFGNFTPEPTPVQGSGKAYGIVDSINDFGSVSNAGGTYEVGYNAFTAGFRWNHHLYCE
jgi:hypothetical protein